MGGKRTVGKEKKRDTRKRILFIVIPIAAVLIITGALYSVRGAREENRIVFIGDSRTVAMYWAVTDDYGSEDICSTGSDGNLWSARSGMGLSWMEETGVPRIEGEIADGDQIVITMGVNDIAQGPGTDEYLAYIKKEVPIWLEKGALVYYVSVNPIRAALSNGLTQEMVDDWNERMQKGLPASVHYIDTASTLKEDADYADDLHYENDTNMLVYNMILSEVEATVNAVKEEG